jgi:DoxX-like family
MRSLEHALANIRSQDARSEPAQTQLKTHGTLVRAPPYSETRFDSSSKRGSANHEDQDRGLGYAGCPRCLFAIQGIVNGSIGLLIPRLANSGALLLVVIMIGATATHVAHREPQVITTVVLLALLGTVVALHKAAAIRRSGMST